MRLFQICGCFLSLLQCSAEDIGRRIDPGYDTYLKNRTIQQKSKDDEESVRIQAEFDARKKDSVAQIQFNSKLGKKNK